jgi:hypothetical protein
MHRDRTSDSSCTFEIHHRFVEEIKFFATSSLLASSACIDFGYCPSCFAVLGKATFQGSGTGIAGAKAPVQSLLRRRMLWTDLQFESVAALHIDTEVQQIFWSTDSNLENRIVCNLHFYLLDFGIRNRHCNRCH